MRTLQFVYILLSLREAFGHLNLAENDTMENVEVLPSTTSDKASSVLRDILNQETLVRFSMVQKIQSLVMDALDRKNTTKVMKATLLDVIKEVRILEEKEKRMKDDNLKLNQKLVSIQATVTEREKLDKFQTVNVLSLQNETNDLHQRINQINKTMNKLEDSLAILSSSFYEELQDIREDQNSSKMALLNISSERSSVCETGWIPYGDHCYYFSRTTTIFQDAITSCYGMGSTLVEPNTIAEERWMLLQGVVTGIKYIWIGVTDLLQNHRFEYISNGNDVQETYNNWDKTLGQPNKGNTEHCVGLATQYKGWHDFSCDRKFHFVCTRRKN
ncbi:low affinity immunoglobulin epsilon Fc receptor-like isoform X1 [Saccostrea cucullata]|uniref:low affinity immunoglobulin epsilon Fc receptor-like isoform X1 n=1 Tax=Saccostrea cuccullata TaxID=36930 RepID=UPI002ED57D02